MYALSKSLLEHHSNYRVEVYYMSILSYDATVIINLSVFGEGDNESYMANYEIIRGIDEKTTEGACVNRPTKEATFEAVEEAAIKALEDKNRKWL